MDSNHRFNRDEISKILKRAAELEHKDDIDDDSEGLTVKELQQVSKEVGLHPKYIQRALDELQAPAHLVSSNIFGGPFTYHLSNSASGGLTEKEWEDVVSEIRRIHGGIGKTSKLGNTYEWEQRKQEVGYIQISLSPKESHTEININANYTYFAFIVSILTGVGCIPLFMFLANEFSNLPSAEILVFGPIIALIIGVRFYLSHWMKKKRRTYGRLFNRLREMLGAEEEKESAPSITIPEDNQDKIEENIIPSGRRRTK
jgi:hypothetical protein